MMLKLLCARTQPLQIPSGVAIEAEEITPHIVVDTVDFPAASVKIGYGF
jgi:hypothetical protein